jgi:hypothetical protein
LIFKLLMQNYYQGESLWSLGKSMPTPRTEIAV